MKTAKAVLWSTALGAALFFHAATGRADGMAARPDQLAPETRAALSRAISAHRAAHPEVFAAVRAVKGVRWEVYSTFRNPIPNAGVELRALGKAALLPMLEALAFDAPPRAGVDDEGWVALSTGMLETVGLLRDAQSAPVVRVVFEASGDPRVSRAAAEAMGRLCGEGELASLVKHSGKGQKLRSASILGLGQCMRVESAERLAALLALEPDAAEAEAIAEALGSVGSSWAWKAMGPAAEAKGEAVRDVAARALIRGFIKYDGQARRRIVKAIMTTEARNAGAMVAEARASATAEAAAALDVLDKQIARQARGSAH